MAERPFRNFHSRANGLRILQPTCDFLEVGGKAAGTAGFRGFRAGGARLLGAVMAVDDLAHLGNFLTATRKRFSHRVHARQLHRYAESRASLRQRTGPKIGDI
jgi:hypothetical protein